MEFNNKSILKSLKKTDLRYSLYFILIIVALLVGKSYVRTSPAEESLLGQIDELKKMNIFFMEEGDKAITIPMESRTLEGNSYRLLLDVKTSNFTALKSDSKTENKVSFTLSLKSDLGETQKLKSYEVDSNHSITLESDFLSKDNYSYITVDKESLFYSGKIEFLNLKIISIEAVSGPSDSKTILGETKETPILNTWSKNEEAFRFTRKSESIGQVFIAPSKMVSSVFMKMKFIGSGGSGDYLLEIKEFDQEKLDLNKNSNAYFAFNKKSIKKHLVDEENNIYEIPLPAFLDEGKPYLLVIRNQNVSFNLLNTLEIYGSQEDLYSAGQVQIGINGKLKPVMGDLFFTMMSATHTTINGVKIPTKAVIQNLRDGRGSFTYRNDGDKFQFLDIDSFSKNENHIAHFDNVQDGVASQTDKGAEIIYRFNTVYPFDKISIDVLQIGQNFTGCEVFYSLDKIEWKKISSSQNSHEPDPDRFQAIVDGSSRNTDVFVKISADPKDIMTEKIKLFGIKSLKISADLIMQK